MAITPATRVSKALHDGGLMTTLSSSRDEGNKVSNTCKPRELNWRREMGMAVVNIDFDWESPTMVNQRMHAAVRILTAAGYRVQERDTRSLDVWEPTWEQYVGKPVPRRLAGELIDENPTK